LCCLANLEKPVIASIDGACLGLGFEIALACHMRFCSSHALFGFPEIGHGIIPGQGGLQRLFSIAGKSRTLEIALTGEVFGADIAKQYGIVNHSVQDKSAFDYTVDFMTKIISMGRKPVAYTIRSVNNATRLDFQSAVKEECHLFAELVIEQYINQGGAIGK
jgi:enoyl-CoA hydratase